MMPQSVDSYLANGCGRCPLGGTPQCKVHSWSNELMLLRSIALETELIETVKWGVPCYTYKNANVILISAFVDFCSVSFMKGVLLKDEAQILVKPGENSRIGRYLKFTNYSQIETQKDLIKLYIQEAIQLEKDGIQVDLSQSDELVFPDELYQIFAEQPEVETAFFKLTPGRQRGYHIYFSGAKQSQTRTERIKKHIPRIMSGLGMHDR